MGLALLSGMRWALILWLTAVAGCPTKPPPLDDWPDSPLHIQPADYTDGGMLGDSNALPDTD